MYKLLKYGVRRLSDGASIPDCEGNVDWREYQAWLKAGNTPEPADIKPEPEPARNLAAELDELKARVSLLEASKG